MCPLKENVIENVMIYKLILETTLMSEIIERFIRKTDTHNNYGENKSENLNATPPLIEDRIGNGQPTVCAGCGKLVTPYDQEDNGYFITQEQKIVFFHDLCWVTQELTECMLCGFRVSPYNKRTGSDSKNLIVKLEKCGCDYSANKRKHNKFRSSIEILIY